MLRIIVPLVFFSINSFSWVNGQYGNECEMPNLQKGQCVPIKSCKSTLELFKDIQKSGDGVSNKDREKLLALKCGTFKNVTLICCLTSEVQLNVDNLNLLQNLTCGVYSDDRVSNGLTARLSGYPWMALLKYDDELTPFKCGGSLISDRYVLTAAHCIIESKKVIAVRLGEHQISTEKDCQNLSKKTICAPPVEDIPIEDIIVHENFHKILYNDIALLRLKRPVEFQRHIKPICLPVFDHLRSKEYSHYILSGWGATKEQTFSDILMVAVLRSVERLQCEGELRKHYLRHNLTVGQICAGGGSDNDSYACRGDSGGPLGYKDDFNGHPRFIQFGLVSAGLNYCGYESPPTTYTNISHYLQWITDHMW